jgi:hypothetical protein
MTLLEDIKKSAERVTGWQRPSREQLAKLVRARKPATFRFHDDGEIRSMARRGLSCGCGRRSVQVDSFWREMVGAPGLEPGTR